MRKSVTLSDAVSIVYAGVSCKGFHSGAEFNSLNSFFQRLRTTSFGYHGAFLCEMRPHSFHVSLPRLRIRERVFSESVLVEVRDDAGVRIPGWRLIELYADFERARDTRLQEARSARRRSRHYEFRDGPVPGVFKHRRHKRKKPHLHSEMISNEVVFEDDDNFDAQVRVRGKRAPNLLQKAIWFHHGRSRRGNSWKEHRSSQWRS